MPLCHISHRSVLSAAALAALAGLASACGGQQSAAAPQGPPPTPVKVATIQSAPLADATEYVATLKSLSSTSINPQVDGYITRIHVKSGDRVQAGTPLIQIDPRRQQASVTSQDAARAAQ